MSLPTPYYADDFVTLYCGRYQDIVPLLGVRVDASVNDPPYSKRTHEGHDDGATLANRGRIARNGHAAEPARVRRSLSYDNWGQAEVAEFCSIVSRACTGWIVSLSDSDLCATWREQFEVQGLTGFQPVPCVISGMTVRLCGDGPSSWAVYANVARPKSLAKWGTLQGAYVGKYADRNHIGGKPLWLMHALLDDYSREGDLILDCCAGGGTTGRAAKDMGRRAVLIEQDEATCAIAAKLLRPHRAWQTSLLDQEPA